MTYISLYRKPVEIHPGKTYLHVGASLGIFTKGLWFNFICFSILNLRQLGDDFQEFYFKAFGKHATAPMLTHIRREIAQAIWMVILDDEFMDAYVHGFLEELSDWITRLGFPRFLTYSADYPEK